MQQLAAQCGRSVSRSSTCHPCIVECQWAKAFHLCHFTVQQALLQHAHSAEPLLCPQEGLSPELTNTQTLHLRAADAAPISAAVDVSLPPEPASQPQAPAEQQEEQPEQPEGQEQGQAAGHQGELLAASDPLSAGLLERERMQQSLMD